MRGGYLDMSKWFKLIVLLIKMVLVIIEIIITLSL
ncbi:MAG: hypothetical protein RLZZ471_416 [Actinomycetota bacterium]|jgi:hypothetical protein